MILYCKDSLGCIDNNNIELINNTRLLINYYIIVLYMMKTAIVIQIEQLGQYGTKFFSYWLTLIRPISVFMNLSRFYIHIEDKTETSDKTKCQENDKK